MALPALRHPEPLRRPIKTCHKWLKPFELAMGAGSLEEGAGELPREFEPSEQMIRNWV